MRIGEGRNTGEDRREKGQVMMGLEKGWMEEGGDRRGEEWEREGRGEDGG